MASDATTPSLAQPSNESHDVIVNGDNSNADSFMENGALPTETTINIKDVTSAPDPNPAGPTPVDDVSSGIQPVADFLPKGAPAHSHPTPPPDQPLATGEPDVDTQMANTDDAAPPTVDATSTDEPLPSSSIGLDGTMDAPLKTDVLPIPAPADQGLVRPREDDAEMDDERAAKRSRVEGDGPIPTESEMPVPAADVEVNGVEASASIAEPSTAESLIPVLPTTDHPIAESLAAPMVPEDQSNATPSTTDPSLATSTTEAVKPEQVVEATKAPSIPVPDERSQANAQPPAAAATSEDVKPSVEAQAAPRPSTAPVESEYSTSPMTPAQKSYLVEKTKNLKKTKSSPFFLKPVDHVALNIPAYPEIIKHPMDLSTLDQKLKTDQYGSVQDFANDFRLIVDNCRTFNGPNHAVTQAANNLDAYFINAVMKNVPSANQPAPQKAAKRSSPAVKAQQPRRESRNVAPAASPTANTETFALQADGMPQIRRESTINRPARAIKPPASREVTYAKPKRKEHQLELKFCEYVHAQIKGPRYSASNMLFQNPVDPVAQNIPHYRQIVKHPMDLSTMGQKLKQGQYAKAGEFKKDFDLMISNCLQFNPPGNPVRDLGIQLQRDFNSLWGNKEKWERANKPESTRATSGSADEESDEEEEDEDAMDAPDENKQQTLEALQKQLAEIQQKLAVVAAPNAKTGKTKKPKSKKSKHEVSAAPMKKSAPAKPAKAKKPKQVTYEEKQEISEAVGNMDETQVGRLTSIITENCTKYRDMDDMELEIDDLPNNVQLLLLSYVREIFGRPKKAASAAAARDTSDDDIAGQDDDDFKPRGNAAAHRADGKRKKHKPMGRSEQTQAIKNLQGKLAEFQQTGSNGSESPTNSGFMGANAAAESSGDDESEESEEE